MRCTCKKGKRIVAPPNEKRALEKSPSVCANCGLLLKDKLQPYYVNLKSLN